MGVLLASMDSTMEEYPAEYSGSDFACDFPELQDALERGAVRFS